MAYYLGIDGGGSKTTCAVGDETSLLATATAGPSNIVRVGEAEARASLHQAVSQACAAAGITPAQVTRTCIGAAGAARPEVANLVRRILAEILSSDVSVVVTGDIQISLEAAFDAGPGIIVIAGTGSIAYGRNQQGTTARAGGWGFAISDEGSAHWIGRAAIAAALRAQDEAINEDGTMNEDRTASAATNHTANPPLLSALLKAWDIRSLGELVRAANATPAPDFSALFPVVAACAEAGDDLARGVLTQAGVELAQLAAVVIRRLFPAPDAKKGSKKDSKSSAPPKPVVPLAMVGGVFRHAPLVPQVFYNEIRKHDARAEVNPQVIDPVEGALRLARKAGAR